MVSETSLPINQEVVGLPTKAGVKIVGSAKKWSAYPCFVSGGWMLTKHFLSPPVLRMLCLAVYT